MNKQRKCLNCGKVIPYTMRSDAVYCSKECRNDYGVMLKRNDRLRAKKEVQEVVKEGGQKEKLSGISEALSYNLLKSIDKQLEAISKQLKIQSGLNEKYLTPSQVLEVLSIKRTTFERFLKDGILKVYRLTGRKIYCKKSDIDKLFKDL